MARALSGDLLGTSLEAVYHTGVVAFGKEYWFGCGLQCAAESTTQTQFGMPLRSVDMGTTEIDETMFEEFLTEVSSRFTPETYNLLRWNCNLLATRRRNFSSGNRFLKRYWIYRRFSCARRLGNRSRPCSARSRIACVTRKATRRCRRPRARGGGAAEAAGLPGSSLAR